MSGTKVLAEIFMALRANGSLDKPVPKLPTPPKQTRYSRALERLFEKEDLQIVRRGACLAGLKVLPVKVKSRRFSSIRLSIEDELCEIHHLTRRHRGEPSCNFKRSTFDTVAAHILLVDIEEEGVLRAFKIPATYLERRFFFDPKRHSGDLRISLKPFSPMEIFELSWTLTRTPPPGA